MTLIHTHTCDQDKKAHFHFCQQAQRYNRLGLSKHSFLFLSTGLMEWWEPWTQRNSSRPSQSSKTRWMCYSISMWVLSIGYISFLHQSCVCDFKTIVSDEVKTDFNFSWLLTVFKISTSHRSMPMNWQMVWSTQLSCFCSKTQSDCLPHTMKALSTSWVKTSFCVGIALQITI